jgi:hypothetical protein
MIMSIQQLWKEYQWKETWKSVVNATAKFLDWVGMVFIHLATIPTLYAVHSGLIDKLPSVDIVLFIWAGLAIWFVRALVQNDRFMLAGIGLGFIIQATFLALILFK